MDLIFLIIKWWKQLAVVMLVAVILSVILSGPYFIKPKYKSFVTIYPSNLISYSNETVTEQMLQIFQSDEIREAVINNLNLKLHYQIDTNKQFFKSNLIKIWQSNVKIKKTEYEAVQIDVLDTDPDMACRIINKMIELFNLKVTSLLREKKAEVVKILKTQLDAKKLEMDTLEFKINLIRKDYNILDYPTQVREATRGYVASNKNPNAAKLLQNLEVKGGDFQQLSAQLDATTDTYLNIKSNYENELKDLTKELTYTNIINKPFPTDRKSFPVRWLITLISTLGALTISFILIIIIEKYKETK